MNIRRKVFMALAFLMALAIEVRATHIRAGEIIAVRISQNSLRYRFTLTLYSDTGSTVMVGEGGIFNFGDGRTIEGGRHVMRGEATFFNEEVLGNETRKTVFQFEHTFNANNVFVITYTEQNRNNNILNINGGASDQTPFHISTVIRIDPGLLTNGTPQLTVPPIDRACVGVRFKHNPGAFDPDGDSLAYKLVTPQEGRGQDVSTYLKLNDPAISTAREDGGTPALFEVDPVTGDFVWDAPKKAGEYNAALIVEEWRFSKLTKKWELLGFVTRDMQILVEDCKNKRPELEIPPDTCVEAGTKLEALVVGRDPDDDFVLVEAFGGVFEVGSNPAKLQQLGSRGPKPDFDQQPVTSRFEWQTDLSHVRTRPYEVRFKISDKPADAQAPALVDFQTWNITVVAPAPKGLTASVASGSSIKLNWDNYAGRNFSPVIQVYRRVDSYDFKAENCETGIPKNSGYKLITELPVSQTAFEDKQGIRPGVKYCYRLVAQFPTPGGGISYASAESCVTIPLDVPAITKVSVQKTDDTNGEILVQWTAPLEIDKTLFPPPYRYELIRYKGLNGGEERTLVTSTRGTTFADTKLNTFNHPYHYRVRFYDAADNLIDSSATASSVRLEAKGLVQSTEITWKADVPWSNRSQKNPYHYIYRDRTDAKGDDKGLFKLIDSVKVTIKPFLYLDDGRFNKVALLDDREYCYYVSTRGSYGNPILPEPLVNNSQRICVEPNDKIPPPKPDVKLPGPDDPDPKTITIGGLKVPLLRNKNCQILSNEPCNFSDYSNTLNWTVDNRDGDIAFYRIYFSPTGEQGTYVLAGTPRDTKFTHKALSSFKGCYRVSAVDRSNNESPLSNPVCFDNCPNYSLPNTFTPNGDGINDTFRAFDRPNAQCPRFVKAVEITVFNRWGGAEVFSYNSAKEGEPNFFIDWDGRDHNGNELPEGTYYYHVKVIFNVFNPALREQEFRNWVQIIR